MKKILAIGMVLCCVWAVCLPVWADLLLPVDIPPADNALVVDNANLLTAAEADALTAELSALGRRYDIHLVIVTVPGVGTRTDEEFADDFYDYNGYADDGAVLLINMDPDNRGWHLSTKGSCIQTFTDARIQQIGDVIVPDLRTKAYNVAFEKFISQAEGYLAGSPDGNDSSPAEDPGNDYFPPEESAGQKIAAALPAVAAMLLAGLTVALIVVRIMIYKMNTVRKQAGAAAYQQALQLTGHSDLYLYSRTTSRRIETSSNSGGGGGSSTHTSSSGSTHGGGGGKF